jgi:hypothetical protein
VLQLHAFLTTALDGDEWSGSRSGRFTHRERAPGTHWIGGWVSPKADMDEVTGKIPVSLYTVHFVRFSSLEDLRTDEMTILRWISKEQVKIVWT